MPCSPPTTRAAARDTKGPQPVPAPRAGAAPQPAISSIARDARAEDGHGAVDAAQRAPFQTVETPAKSEQIRSKLSAGAAAAAAAACTVSDFTSKTGAALVQQVKSAEPGCVNTLFTLKGADARAAFREAQMVTIADALRANVANYPGDNSTSTLQLVLFLRAGYFVQWYDTAVGDYGPALKSSIEGALDAFFAAPRSADANDANGNILAETVTLIDSSQRNARYLYVVKRLLTNYTNSYNSSWYMVAATNNAYNVLFRGHQMDDFLPAAQADPALFTVLRDFAVAHDDLLGTDQWYLAANAGRELGRFLRHDALKPTIRPLVKELLGRSSITGRTGSLWIALAEMADSYDQANCAYYEVCDLAAKLKAAVLTVKYTCSPSIRIVAQEMTEANLAAACTSLTSQDAYFHKVVQDKGPVADDNNTSIEVVVFNSSADYKSYAGKIFDISTDNGGMYLEGKPEAAGNQPRFVAYEAEWLRPDFQIWNLNHEYTHYLDGRFDMYGDFRAGQTTPTVMWVEGFAEYVSYSYRGVTYDRAVTEAGKNTYKLSTLFDTTYDNSDSTKVYQWGYLAVRYLLQSHPQDMTALLAEYRTGDWAGARTLLTSTIGTRYDADFAAWLAKCAAGDCGTTAPGQPGSLGRLHRPGHRPVGQLHRRLRRPGRHHRLPRLGLRRRHLHHHGQPDQGLHRGRHLHREAHRHRRQGRHRQHQQAGRRGGAAQGRVHLGPDGRVGQELPALERLRHRGEPQRLLRLPPGQGQLAEDHRLRRHRRGRPLLQPQRLGHHLRLDRPLGEDRQRGDPHHQEAAGRLRLHQPLRGQELRGRHRQDRVLSDRLTTR
ncbi:hypothetical protein GCM10020229_18010 [Kitasatospora albolonga]